MGLGVKQLLVQLAPALINFIFTDASSEEKRTKDKAGTQLRQDLIELFSVELHFSLHL